MSNVRLLKSKEMGLSDEIQLFEDGFRTEEKDLSKVLLYWKSMNREK